VTLGNLALLQNFYVFRQAQDSPASTPFVPYLQKHSDETAGHILKP
jgi:hypothetical protein